MKNSKLLSPISTEAISLRNRIVMAPMNRRRASNGIPTPSMMTYYKQRANAGLIITDNTAVSQNAGGHLDTPGIFNKQQLEGWKSIVDAVHDEGGKIVVQLVHAGRVGHSEIANHLPLVAPSALKLDETILLPGNVYASMSEPVAIATEEISTWVSSYVKASVDAMEIGFDGVEIHAAHGFLIDQFLNPHSNKRDDQFGGSIENRSRFLLEVMQAVAHEIGRQKTGIRLSPFMEINGMKSYESELGTHRYIIDNLQKLEISYVHFSSTILKGKPTISRPFLRDIRRRFKNLIIVAGGYTADSGEKILRSGLVDLVAFGKLFISNPDLTYRIANNLPLASWDQETFYHGGDLGYIDYPSVMH